jgi:hypothetical protein
MSFFPGDTIKPSASREREVTRLLEAARGERASFGVNGRYKMEPGHVLVRNDTGADLGFGKAAMIDRDKWYERDVQPRKEPEYRTGFVSAIALAPIITGMSPRPSRLGVTIEPIKAGRFGVMAIAGLAVATESTTNGYVAPAPGGVIVQGMFGFAKVVTNPERGGNFSIWDLSTQNMYAAYEITAKSGTSITGRLVADYTSLVLDSYGIAAWQVVGDSGMAFWNGDAWVIVSPWCPGSNE